MANLNQIQVGSTTYNIEQYGDTITKISAGDGIVTNTSSGEATISVDSDVQDAVTKKHSHDNKALLDTYTQTEANLADAVSKKHEHSNKSVLDGIASTDITNWNNKQDSESGKGLSTNDYTTAEKTKLSNLADIRTIGAGLLLLNNELKIGKPTTWAEVQYLTRLGIIQNLLSVGDTLTFTRDGTNISAKVMDFITNGRNGSIKIKDTSLKNGVIFQTTDCVYNLQFDEREAFYSPSETMVAGSYSFVLGAHSWYSADVGKTFYFTLASDVPAGGQLVFVQNYNATLEGATINVFNSSSTYTANQTTTMSSTEISGATSLGTLNNAINGRLNSCQRALLGNNNWKESAARQQLNSDDAAGSVWSAQNVWDRPPSWRTSTKGFLNGLSSDLLDYVATVELDTYRNTLCDGGGYDTTEDKFFLAGRKEVFMPTESSDDNGEPWAFYKDNSTSSVAHTGDDAVRIKKLGTSAVYWWQRSPYVGHAHAVRNTSRTGGYDGSNANGSIGIAPAFVIA